MKLSVKALVGVPFAIKAGTEIAPPNREKPYARPTPLCPKCHLPMMLWTPNWPNYDEAWYSCKPSCKVPQLSYKDWVERWSMK